MAPQSTTKYSFLTAKRDFFSLEVPLWTAVVSLIILTAALTGGFMYFRQAQYTFKLPTENGNLKLHYGAIPALSQPDYFTEVKNLFLKEKSSFVEADLSAMKITVYENGQPTLEVPIVTKGKEGSWWETPAGIYKIETKEQSHFSSIGEVYQPWSMQFQGNFFIHGWPYYPDGTDVSSAYSGGCIRLKTDDSKLLYDAVRVGMPVLVFEKDFTQDSFGYTIKQPTTTASQYLVADLKSNAVILNKDSETAAPIGTVTKLVNALVAAEYINLDKEIAISTSMLASTSKPRLRAGQDISVYNLMFPLLMEDSNEAATAVARQLGENYFTSLMNEKSKALGMTKTRYADVSGESNGNTATPSDLFALAKYLYNNRSFILKISSGSITSSIYGTPVFSNLRSVHVPEGTSKSFVGGVKGVTADGKQTYVGIFELTVHGEKRPIVVVLLGSENALTDAVAMVAYVEEMYK
jgi:hypothetical protein